MRTTLRTRSSGTRSVNPSMSGAHDMAGRADRFGDWGAYAFIELLNGGFGFVATVDESSPHEVARQGTFFLNRGGSERDCVPVMFAGRARQRHPVVDESRPRVRLLRGKCGHFGRRQLSTPGHRVLRAGGGLDRSDRSSTRAFRGVECCGSEPATTPLLRQLRAVGARPSSQEPIFDGLEPQPTLRAAWAETVETASRRCPASSTTPNGSHRFVVVRPAAPTRLADPAADAARHPERTT